MAKAKKKTDTPHEDEAAPAPEKKADAGASLEERLVQAEELLAVVANHVPVSGPAGAARARIMARVKGRAGK